MTNIKDKSKKVFKFAFVAIFTIWLTMTILSFIGIVIKQTYRGIDLKQNNIDSIEILMVLSLLILFLFPLYLFISERKEKLINLYKNHLYLIIYNLFLLLEIIIGVYLAVTIFEFGYTNYDPRLGFFITTLTLLIIIQHIKKITLGRINHWEIKN